MDFCFPFQKLAFSFLCVLFIVLLSESVGKKPIILLP